MISLKSVFGSAGSAFQNRVQFLASTTWTVPANVFLIEVWATGGGNAGGGSGGSNNTGGAGGAASSTGVQQFNVTPGQILTITVGAGGIGAVGGSGGAGGNSAVLLNNRVICASSHSNHAQGGGLNTNAQNTAFLPASTFGWQGGSGAGGGTTGNAGGAAFGSAPVNPTGSVTFISFGARATSGAAVAPSGGGGPGGSSFYGAGGNGSNGANPGPSANGSNAPATSYGAGGGGAGGTNGGVTASAGGNGANGIVEIYF